MFKMNVLTLSFLINGLGGSPASLRHIWNTNDIRMFIE